LFCFSNTTSMLMRELYDLVEPGKERERERDKKKKTKQIYCNR